MLLFCDDVSKLDVAVFVTMYRCFCDDVSKADVAVFVTMYRRQMLLFL